MPSTATVACNRAGQPSDPSYAIDELSRRAAARVVIAAYRAGRAAFDRELAMSRQVADLAVREVERWIETGERPAGASACSKACGSCHLCDQRNGEIYERYHNAIMIDEIASNLAIKAGERSPEFSNLFDWMRDEVEGLWSSINILSGQRIVAAINNAAVAALAAEARS